MSKLAELPLPEKLALLPPIPWQRLKTETKVAFDAFEAYRDYPYKQGKNRSQENVAQLLRKSKGLMQRWSVQHCWPYRAEKFDEWIAEEDLKLLKQEYLSARREFIRRQIKLADKAGKVSDEIQKAMEVMAKWPLVETVVEYDEEGRPVKIMKPAGWNKNTVANYAAMWMRLQEIWAGLRTQTATAIEEPRPEENEPSLPPPASDERAKQEAEHVTLTVRYQKMTPSALSRQETEYVMTKEPDERMQALIEQEVKDEE